MASILLTDESGTTTLVSSGEHQNKLAAYLLHDLSFAFQHIDFHALGDQRLSDINPFEFPFRLKASRSGGFEVGQAFLSIAGGASATFGQLAGNDAAGLLGSLGLDALPAEHRFLSFGIAGHVDLGPNFSSGDFSFGVSKDKQIGLTFYRPVLSSLTLKEATEQTLRSFTIPASVADLRNLDPGSVASLDGSGALTFSASADYGFFNNPLLSLPVSASTGPLSLGAGGSASVQVAVTLSHDHEITFARSPDGKLRLSVDISQGIDVDTSFDVSAGLAAHFGQHDPLAFLLGRISPNPADDLLELESALSPDQAGDIKSVLIAAMDHSLKASFHEELDAARSRSTLFLYEIDLAALDAAGEAALQSALNGNLLPLTSRNWTGVKTLDCAYSRLTQRTHTVTVHLLGLLNATDVRTFLKHSKVAVSPESGEIVITDFATAQEIKILDITPDAQQLRRVLLRNASLTAAYKGTKTNVGVPGLACSAVYFLKKANTGDSQLHQHLNALAAVRPALGASTIVNLIQQIHPNNGNSQLYLSVGLGDDQCRNLFIKEDAPVSKTSYEIAGRAAMHTLLMGDEPNSYRLAPMKDDHLWDSMSAGGSVQNVAALFPQLSPLQTRTLYTDYLTIAFWADSMSKCAAALAKLLHFFAQHGETTDPHSPALTEFRNSLTNASAKAVKDLDSGFDMPWGVLAINFLVNPPPKVVVRFASSLLAYSDSGQKSIAGAAGAAPVL